MIRQYAACMKARGTPMRHRSLLSLVGFALVIAGLPKTTQARCPNWCSQHGICTGPGDDAICICEMGYQGDDCGIRMCPKGNDPLTTDQRDRAIMLRTTAEGGTLAGELSLTFNDEITSFAANAHASTDRDCIAAVQALPNIERASCSRGAVDEFGGAEYVISILSHAGNPGLDAFSCNITEDVDGNNERAVSPSCEVVDLVAENVKDYVECSRHGHCERETGRCECNFGFHGDACDDISDADDAQVVLAEGPFFTGSTLKLRANRGPSANFDFIRALAGPHDVMTLAGTGDLRLLKGGLFIQPGTSPRASWNKNVPPTALEVSGGSLGVLGGGAEITSTRSDAPALAVRVGWNDSLGDGDASPRGGDGLRREGASGPFSGVALAVAVRDSAASERANFRLLELSAGGRDVGIDGEPDVVMSVGGDGRVFMGGGGDLELGQGNLIVSEGDATIKRNTSIGGALSIGSGGVEVDKGGSIVVNDGGLQVRLTDRTANAASIRIHYATDSDGPADHAAVGILTASHSDFSGDVLRVRADGAGAADAGAVLLRASSGGEDMFEIKATGATCIKAGGLDVDAGGLRVASGGIDVGSGGIAVDGGLHLRSGTIVIDDIGGGGSGNGNYSGRGAGLEVLNGGIRAASGDSSTAALAATVRGKDFGGTVLAVSAPGSLPSPSFQLLQATVGGAQEEEAGVAPGQESEVFVVDGTGRIAAAGGLETGVGADVVAGGRLISKGPTILEGRRATREASGDVSQVEVDTARGSFFEVPDDGRHGSANVVRIKGRATPGQILVLRNSDADPTSGDIAIPPGYVILVIYDGETWRDLRVLGASVTELKGVSELTAANDLDIGDFTLKASNLVSTAAKVGEVAIYGGGGLLAGDKGFTFDPATGTLTVPRLQASEMAGEVDFRGRAARNVALVNATIDRIPFLKTSRLMVDTAVLEHKDGARTSALADSGSGVAVFDKKGELSRAQGLLAGADGQLEVAALGPHVQAGNVDFQGYTARNLSLSGVTALTGLDRLEVRELTLAAPAQARTDVEASPSQVKATMAILTSKGELRSAGPEVALDRETQTLLATKIGSHDVTGDVDFLGNVIRGAVLEGPEFRGTVPKIRTGAISLDARPSASRGHVALLFSREDGEDGDEDGERSRSLGHAGLAWRDGALQDVRLGGTTTLEGDLDLGGHRLLNFEAESAEHDQSKELTIGGALTLSKHASSPGSLLAIGAAGVVTPADPSNLSVRAASAHVSGEVTAEALTCKGHLKLEGDMSVAGTASMQGTVELGAGLDAKGSRISNASLERAKFEGAVAGDVKVDGDIALRSLQNAGGGIVTASADGGLKVAAAASYDEDGGLFVVKKISGHEVAGDVDFGGQALRSAALNFSNGGGIHGLSRLAIGTDGLHVEGLLHSASDVVIDGSVTVAGAVMGRGPYMDTSDERVKENIEDISARDACSVVKALRAISYTLKTDLVPLTMPRGPRQGEQRQLGFLAQEVESVVPEVVSEDAGGFKVVAYSRLIPLLASALSGALDRIEELERRVARGDDETATAFRGSAANPRDPSNGGAYDAVFTDRRLSPGDLETLPKSGGSTARTHSSMAPAHFAQSSRQPEPSHVHHRSTGVKTRVRAHRRAVSVGVGGQEDQEDEVVVDRMQLMVENTALRVRVRNLEERLLSVEHALEQLPGQVRM